jgi:deazaflavin-dependent oxidoreductase (nitroreductase family)
MNTVPHYSVPTASESRFNGFVRWLSDRGIGVAGARTLIVTGRTTGVPQSVPVNPLSVNGSLYVISPRGNTQWSRNLRASGTCEIRRGRKRHTYVAIEVDNSDKVELLRPYLKRWGWEIGRYLPTKVSHTSTDEQLLEVGQSVPIFELRLSA